MRDSLGDFTSCKTPSKYAARIGQCFSTTVQGLNEGSVSQLRTTDRKLRVGKVLDVLAIHKGKQVCHSDGNGLIRRELLDKVVKRLPFGPIRPEDVSIIQIRFGGAKGTLTAWDLGEPQGSRYSADLEGLDICLRPSMVKFEDSYKYLEICCIGAHVPYYLNRNVILLLGYHGVQNETFIGMQRAIRDDLDELLVNREMALKMLHNLVDPKVPRQLCF